MSRYQSKWLLLGIEALFLIFALQCAADPSELPHSEKLKPPAAAEQARAEKSVREIFAADLAPRTPAARSAAAQKLLDEAPKNISDPTARFVLLRDARDLAVNGGNVEVAWKAIEQLDASYVVDAAAMKVDALLALRRENLTPNDASLAARYGSELIRSSVDLEDFATAEKLFAAADSLAARSREVSTVESTRKQIATARAMAEQYNAVGPAAEILKTRPQDPAASETVGEYLCFSKADWKKGAAILVYGSDPTLSAAVQKELNAPDTTTGQKQLADLWWEIGEKRTGISRDAIRAHAAALYANAIGGLSGLELILARKRIAEAPAPAHGGAINLLPLIDLRRDTVAGNWTIEDNVLKTGGDARLSIPYQPPEEYDFVIEFTRIGGRDQVWQIGAAGKSQIIWTMGSWGKIMRLGAGNRTLANSEDPACTENGVKFRSVLRIRRKHVSALLNGKLVAESDGPFDPAPAPAGVPDMRALGIGAWYAAPTAFSKIELVPVSGTGHVLAGPSGSLK